MLFTFLKTYTYITEPSLPTSIDDNENENLVQVDADLATTVERIVFKKSCGKQTRVSRRQYIMHQMQVRNMDYHPV